jgi:starch phosphorylase
VVFSGKAHPRDWQGKDLIKSVYSLSEELKEDIKIAFVEGYNMDIAKKIVSGVDIWLNTPLRPMEASGTSGMKAAHNGVPHFSFLDGWWIEGHIEDITGWAIGPDPKKGEHEDEKDKRDAEDMYKKLENRILPLFYEDREN